MLGGQGQKVLSPSSVSSVTIVTSAQESCRQRRVLFPDLASKQLFPSLSEPPATALK